MEITLETDWGAKGAQLTGAQVQSFLKQQLRELIAKDKTLQANIDGLSERLTIQGDKIDAVTDGCLVAYHRKSDNWPVAVPYLEWPEIEASGEVADGVLVLVDGRAPILVAPTEKKLFWSKYNYEVDIRVGMDHELAFADFTGQTRTAALISKSSDLFGTSDDIAEEYAITWCYNYSRSYKYHDLVSDKVISVGVPKNRWWHPSIAELVVIWKHKYAINLCLSVIKDAMPLSDTWYWSSTEATASTVWRLHMGTGAIQGNNNKTTFQHQTRAITSFYNPSIFNGDSDTDDELKIADSRFKRFGDCIVFIADENAKPIAIKYPLTEDKIQAAIINRRYSDDKISLITTNYQLSMAEGFDADLKAQYLKEYTNLQRYQTDALTISKNVFVKKQVTP